MEAGSDPQADCVDPHLGRAGSARRRSCLGLELLPLPPHVVSVPTGRRGILHALATERDYCLCPALVTLPPLLLLPVASNALVKVTGSNLTAPTVLGVRRVPLPPRKQRWIRLPGEGYGLRLVVVSGARGRLCIIAASEVWGSGGASDQVSRMSPQPPRLPSRVAGFVGFMSWLVFALLLGSSLAGLAGAL